MTINASKEYQDSLLSYLPIKNVEEWPEEVCLTIGIWVSVEMSENKKNMIKAQLAKSVGVDLSSVETDVAGGRGTSVICTEIMVNKGQEKHAVDWIYELSEKVDNDFRPMDMVSGIILDPSQ